MARPRVFVSSTYFDLRAIRADIERFIREMGFEAVLFERGHIAWGKQEALEEYCYREVSSCDIIVSIIGGKFGSQSKDQKNSITQREIRAALEQGKQLYIFVDKAVHSEYRTYLANKENESFRPATVNDKRVFQFIEEMYALPAGNPIEAFELPEDITRYLKEQWAGLFQRLLQENSRVVEVNVIEGLRQTAATLNSLVSYLADEKVKGDQAIKEILLSNHPAFAALKTLAGIPYRVIFNNVDEVGSLLGARGFVLDENSQVPEEYQWDNEKLEIGIAISRSIFDDSGALKILTPEQWQKGLMRKYQLSASDEDEEEEEEEEFPF